MNHRSLRHVTMPIALAAALLTAVSACAGATQASGSGAAHGSAQPSMPPANQPYTPPAGMSPDCVTFTVLLSQTEQLVAAQSITGFRAFAAKVEAQASAIKDPAIKKGMTSLALYYNQLAAFRQQPKSAGPPDKSLTANVDTAANACDRYYSAHPGSTDAAPAA